MVDQNKYFSDKIQRLEKEIEYLTCRESNMVSEVIKINSENDGLKEENEFLKNRIKEIDLRFGKLLLTMQASVIEMNHGNGHAAAMEWIFNALLGPGELPLNSESDAELYFERESKKIDNELDKCMDFFNNNRGHTNV